MNTKAKWGILLIALGVLLQLQSLNIIESISAFWPSLVVLAGILLLLERATDQS